MLITGKPVEFRSRKFFIDLIIVQTIEKINAKLEVEKVDKYTFDLKNKDVFNQANYTILFKKLHDCIGSRRTAHYTGMDFKENFLKQVVTNRIVPSSNQARVASGETEETTIPYSNLKFLGILSYKIKLMGKWLRLFF